MHHKRSSPMQSSAAIVGGNDDLLTEILLFLPAKSLIRFKLVSKHWSSLISAASFSRLHLLHHARRRPEPQHSFILGGITSQFFICHPTVKKFVPFRFRFPYVKILQSCNGLMLLECRKFPQGRKDYCIFNPTTMQYRELYLYGTSAGLRLMFDPSKSHHYRVVRFTNDGDLVRFSVYDSSTHKWTDGGEFQHGPFRFWDGVFWNGRIYFIRYRDHSFCFSPEDKIDYSVPDPRTRGRHVRGMKKYVMEANGHLHYISLSEKSDELCLYVYEMIDKEWSNISGRANSKPVSAALFAGDKTTEFDLLGMIREERLEDSMLLFHVPGKIMTYRFCDEVGEVLVDFTNDYFCQEGRLQFEFKDAYPFIESLAPV